jgi:amino acid transporter
MFRDYDECGSATGGYTDIFPTLIIGMIMMVIFLVVFMPILNTVNPTNTSEPNLTHVNDKINLSDMFKNTDYTLLFNIIMLIVGLYIGYLIFKYLICYHPFRSVSVRHYRDEGKKPKKKKPMFVDVDMHDLKAEDRNDSIFNKDNEQESEPHWKVFKKR